MKEKGTINSSKELSHVHISRQGDREVISEYKDRFKLYSNKELIKAYNALNGLYGVHPQALHFIALRQEFLERFNQSPFKISMNNLIGLGDKISYIESSKKFAFVEQN